MTFLAAARMAAAALVVHKGRSALTSLGVVIGVGAVVAMVAAGDGVQEKLDERLAAVGKNLILVRAGARTKTGTVADTTPLTRDDADALRKHAGHLLVGVAEVQLTQRVAATRTTNWTTLVCGTTPEMQAVREWKLAAGRFLTAAEVTASAEVCVLGETVRKKLFPDDPHPLGQLVRVENLQLRVVGVLAPKGRNPTGADQDDEMFIPLTTLQRKLVGDEHVHVLLTAAREEHLTARAMEEITNVLRKTHRVKPGGEDFDVSSVAEMAELGYFITDTMKALVAVIASLSLVVGGIGIMNIMLVSVTERTREIGIRMAVGATPGDVLAQFLTEAVILSLGGGVLGVLGGVGVAVLLAGVAGWPVVLAPAVVALALLVSVAVGVFFGFYPAWKASRLDPIEALRYE